MANVTEISELANVPREIKIKDVTLKVRQLKIKEIFGYFEQQIRNKKIEEAQIIADMMRPEERKDFLLDVWKSLPSGSELTSKVTDVVASVDGVCDLLYLASKDFVDDANIEKIRSLVDFENIDELVPIINWVAGMDRKEDSSEKKTKTEKK